MIDLSKQQLREKIKEQLAKLANDEYHKSSKKIAEKLFSTNEWKSAQHIGITLSIFPEVDTYYIIKKAWSEGKKVAVPKCIPKSRQLNFRSITNFDQVDRGYFNLFEPLIDRTTEVNKSDISLLIVPGLAFTNEGERLGFGGGYYDRFLPFYNGETVSLAFNQQILKKLPTQAHDQKVKKVITE